MKGLKYKVVKRNAEEFGLKSHVFVIVKRTWIGSYWDTDEYYFKEKSANDRCMILNCSCFPKFEVNSDNTVNIIMKQQKDSWNREDLFPIIKKALNADGIFNDKFTNKWIEENL